MMNALAVVAVFLAALTGAALAADPIVLTGAHVLDPSGERLLDNRAVLIEGDHITDVAPLSQLHVPADAQTIDCRALTIIPGLIDLHTHLLLHPYNETPWTDQVMHESLALRTCRATVAARKTLDAGFTTIRDLGTEGAGFADVGIRDAIDQGIIPGPTVIAVTKAIVASHCYAPFGFDPRWMTSPDFPVGAEPATGPDECRRVVREQIQAGADWIKVYADYRRRPGAPSTPTFSQEELNAMVAEATSAGLPVAAHATTDEGARRAVLAGVRTIEHGYNVTPETLRLMAEHHVALCPTLAAAEAYATYEGWNPDDPTQPEPERVRVTKLLMKNALAAGVTIACGSDIGVFPHGTNAHEIELMVDYGMTPTQALRAATTTAAAVIGRGDDLGEISPRYVADMVVVKGDPLADVKVLREPVVVIRHGVLALDRR